MISTILVLGLSNKLGYISFPSLERKTFVKIWPLPLIYVGNMMFGLGGTQQLRYFINETLKGSKSSYFKPFSFSIASLPMLTVLRRFSILMTMAAEYYILG